MSAITALQRIRHAVPKFSTAPPNSPDVFHLLTRDIPWVDQPNVSPPIVRIQYSSEFSLTMGIYLSLMKVLGLASSTIMEDASGTMQLSNVLKGSGDAEMAAKFTARWLVVLGNVLSRCPSHYTAWQQRRNVVMSPQALLDHCTVEAFCESLPVEVQEPLQKPVPEGQCEYTTTRVDDLPLEAQDMVRYWCPSRDELVCRTGVCGSGACRWKSIAWELRLIEKTFVRDYHKNFQLWHHRKELIEWGIAATPASALVSPSAFSDYLATHHGAELSFDDFDERQVCDVILMEEDSKNYHVWSHRMWFLTAGFPFVARNYKATVNVKALPLRVAKATSSNSSTYHANEARCLLSVSVHAPWENAAEPAFEPIKSLDELRSVMQGCLPLIVSDVDSGEGDACLVHQELCFTQSRIGEDYFNNSAWCHRFAVLKRFVLDGWVLPDSSLKEDLRQWAMMVCLAEVHFGLQWAVWEPCNECPFVYVKGICDLWIMFFTTSTSSSSAIDFHLFTRSLWLSNFAERIIETHIAPRAEALRQAGGAPPSNNDAETALQRQQLTSAIREKRSQFLQNNTHQPIAALYRIHFEQLETLWSLVMSDDERKGLSPSLAGIPSSRVSGDEVERKSVTEYFLSLESRALAAVRALYHIDTIRSKYWKHEAHLVLHRIYH